MANVLDGIKGMGAARSIALAFVAAAVMTALVVFSIWGYAPDYQVLYSQLSGADSGAVIDKLREKRIQYKVDGSTIMVPAEKVYEVRMELAGEGIPHGGGVGFEIFDKTGFGVTQFVQKVNYKRALQGELARTITQLTEVESARVHMVIPEKGIFLGGDKKPASASIVLKLKPGAVLSAEQVASIVHLVANSSEDIASEDVAVVDTTGRMWSDGNGETSSMRLSASQLDFRASMERDLEGRVQSMLESTVGAGKVVARVSAEVDTRHIERTEESYDPESQVVRSEQRNKEKSIGAMASAGVPGVLSNVPGGTGSGGGTSSPAQTQRADEVVNYEINKVVSRVIEPVNDIKRLTVSVLVDGLYTTVEDAEGNPVRQYQARGAEELASFTELVKGAVGFREGRGDVVKVVSTPFESALSAVAAEPEAASPIPFYIIPTAIKYVSIVIVSIFAMLFILRPMTRKLMEDRGPSGRALPATPNELPPGGDEVLGLMSQGGAERSAEMGKNIMALKKVVSDNPQQAAMVVKNWVKEK